MPEDTSGSFVAACTSMRDNIEEDAKIVKAMMGHAEFEGNTAGPSETRDFGEMRANIMLAYRHLEDAKMRLGKAIQAQAESPSTISSYQPPPVFSFQPRAAAYKTSLDLAHC
jgi:hypothetical protein